MKTAELLKTLGVYNSHNFYEDQPYISQRVKHDSRDVVPSSWQIHKRGVSFSSAWYDYGAKTFSYGGIGSNREALAAAKNWAEQKFGFVEWKRDPFGSYGREEVRRETVEGVTG
jgi:hypothetical protein